MAPTNRVKEKNEERGIDTPTATHQLFRCHGTLCDVLRASFGFVGSNFRWQRDAVVNASLPLSHRECLQKAFVSIIIDKVEEWNTVHCFK